MPEISLADVNAKVKQKVEKRYRVATYKLKHFKNSTKNSFQKIFKVARMEVGKRRRNNSKKLAVFWQLIFSTRES